MLKTERRHFEFHFVLLFEILDVDEVDDADVDAVEDGELNFIFLLRYHRHRLVMLIMLMLTMLM